MSATDDLTERDAHNAITDAQGDLLRGLQVVETAIGITSTLMGDKLEGASLPTSIDRAQSYRNA